MRLHALSLYNFRNYKRLTVHCESQANLFVGENGQGKTNLLEAIYYLCITKSQRGARDLDLIAFGQKGFRIKGEGIDKRGKPLQIEIAFSTEKGKQAKLNHQPQSRVTELIGHLAVVCIAPEDDQITQGNPALRRRFLDIALSQVSPLYLARLQEYRRVVRQRNEILRQYRRWPGRGTTLEVWTEQLVQLGSQIIDQRGEAIEVLKRDLKIIHGQISGGREQADLIYRPALNLNGGLSTREAFARHLARLEKEERQRGMTLIGPHRDDLLFRVNGLDLRSFGSQGQHRTTITALKLAEARFIGRYKAEPPILLLDDVLAKLDSRRTDQLIDLFKRVGQVFVTVAKESDLGNRLGEFRRFYVRNGTVRQMS